METSSRYEEFDVVLEIIRGVKKLGMEACATLGMITKEQAQQLANAGLTAYNHNIDTSPEYYKNVTSTRTFSDRLATLKLVQKLESNLLRWDFRTR